MDLGAYSYQKIDELFEMAYTKVSETEKKFPQDVLLYFYAFYKQAKNESDLKITQNPVEGENLVSAFKANAIFQVKKISPQESKINYIELDKKHLGNEFQFD